MYNYFDDAFSVIICVYLWHAFTCLQSHNNAFIEWFVAWLGYSFLIVSKLHHGHLNRWTIGNGINHPSGNTMNASVIQRTSPAMKNMPRRKTFFTRVGHYVIRTDWVIFCVMIYYALWHTCQTASIILKVMECINLNAGDLTLSLKKKI